MNFLYLVLLIILCQISSPKLVKKSKVNQNNIEYANFLNENEKVSLQPKILYNFDRTLMPINQLRCLDLFSEVIKTLPQNLQIAVVKEFENSSNEVC